MRLTRFVSKSDPRHWVNLQGLKLPFSIGISNRRFQLKQKEGPALKPMSLKLDTCQRRNSFYPGLRVAFERVCMWGLPFKNVDFGRVKKRPPHVENEWLGGTTPFRLLYPHVQYYEVVFPMACVASKTRGLGTTQYKASPQMQKGRKLKSCPKKNRPSEDHMGEIYTHVGPTRRLELGGHVFIQKAWVRTKLVVGSKASIGIRPPHL